jgi:adenylate kinase family enzyme
VAGRRIHVLGASGSGTSTLARGLASSLGSQCFDTDDFYWKPTDPPFREKRPIAERLELMNALFLPRRDWILSGSFTSWGAEIVPRLTHVIFLTLPAAKRLARLRKRERMRADGTLLKSKDWRVANAGFLEWAMAYDDPDFPGRSRITHERWLDMLEIPVIRLDGDEPPETLLARAIDALDASNEPVQQTTNA